MYPGFGELATPEAARDALGRAHAVVLGPGLGRGDDAAVVAAAVIGAATSGSFPPLVLDADALFFLTRERALLSALRAPGGGAPRVLLTPNAAELRMLCAAVDAAGVSAGAGPLAACADPNDARALADWFGSGPPGGVTGTAGGGVVVLVLKGVVDRVVASRRGEVVYEEVCAEGSRKRCGGQGDVLAGLVALYAGWVGRSPAGASCTDGTFPLPVYVHAAAAACATTREAGRLAFAMHRRSMVASQMIAEIGQAFEHVHDTLS